MAFGKPTKYLQMDINKVAGGEMTWNRAIDHASDVYSRKMVLSLQSKLVLQNVNNIDLFTALPLLGQLSLSRCPGPFFNELQR